MSNKQNNDDFENSRVVKSSFKTATHQTRINQPVSQKESISQSDDQNLQSTIISKNLSQNSSLKKAQSKQSKLTIAPPTSPPTHQTLLLPITITLLQQKPLNTYLKQFMQISTFQTIQKGKQLLQLIKQSPSSKQTTSILNKCMKLFKSNIPDAVLCSFQFLREVVEVGCWKITEMVEEMLLMPMVEIVQYRAYLVDMERGNSYFLSEFYRYGQDEKLNHLVKIGSTFFRMVHQVLYVWGTFYFPESGFNKMLTKLINSEKIKFPSFPHQFKFYSQARVDLYKNLIEKNRKLYQKEEIESKLKKSPQNVKESSKAKHLQNFQNESSTQKNNDLKKQTKTVQHQKQETHQPISDKYNQSKQQIPREKKLDQKIQKTISKENSPSQQKRNEHPIIKSESFNNEMESIDLKRQTKKQSKQENEQKKLASNYEKSIEEFKKIKPTKTKSKKSTFSITASQKSIQIQKSRVKNINQADNALKLIEVIEQIEVYETNEEKNQTKSSKQSPTKSQITKEMLKIDLKKFKNQRSQSQMYVKNSSNQTNGQAIEVQHTFRKVDQHDNESEEQRNFIFGGTSKAQESGTVREMTSERERFVQPLSEDSIDRDIIDNKSTKPNEITKTISQLKYSEQLIKQIFRKELSTLKASIIDGIKKDMVEVVMSQKQKVISGLQQANDNKAHLEKDCQKQDQKKISDSKPIQEHRTSIKFHPLTTEQQNKDPSTEAFEFIKQKFKSRKRLRSSSKVKKSSISKQEELNQLEQSIPSQKMRLSLTKNQTPIIIKPASRVVVEYGINTEEIRNEQLYEEISQLRERINLVVSVLPGPKPLSLKRNNNFSDPPNYSTSIYITPKTINKNQIRTINHLKEIYQPTSSLRSTVNSTRKRSKSKLSQRRSSLQASLLEKAVSRPQSCRNLFEEVYGNSNTFLFNAAVNSVHKKRKSVMFC